MMEDMFEEAQGAATFGSADKRDKDRAFVVAEQKKMQKQNSIKVGQEDWAMSSDPFALDKKPKGSSALTYGWVMLINVWVRSLTTQMLAATVNAKYPGVGL